MDVGCTYWAMGMSDTPPAVWPGSVPCSLHGDESPRWKSKPASFTKPGASVQLKCDIHPWMETWVYVSDSSLYAVTGADGKFSIEGVPAGSYDLEVWHPHLGRKTAKITIKAGETTTATIPAFGPADYKAPQ